MKTPEIIFTGKTSNWINNHETCWLEKERLLDSDIEYIRKDIADKEKEELKTEIQSAIEDLESKRNSFLGTEGELARQSFKCGLGWAITSFEMILSK